MLISLTFLLIVTVCNSRKQWVYKNKILGNKIKKCMWISTPAYPRVLSPTFLFNFYQNYVLSGVIATPIGAVPTLTVAVTLFVAVSISETVLPGTRS